MRVFNPRVRIEEKSVRQFSKGSAKERGRVVRCKMATRPSPEIEEYWPKKVLPNWGRKKSRSSTLGEEVNRHLCTQASHRWRELWRVLQESRKNFGKKKENRGRTRQWQPPTLPPRIPRVREGEWFLCIERGRRREKIWWETRSREILWSLTEVSVESGLSGDEN